MAYIEDLKYGCVSGWVGMDVCCVKERWGGGGREGERVHGFWHTLRIRGMGGWVCEKREGKCMDFKIHRGSVV